MNCPRCSGLLVLDTHPDAYDDEGQPLPFWRCLLCGEILDGVIARHRSWDRPTWATAGRQIVKGAA